MLANVFRHLNLVLKFDSHLVHLCIQLEKQTAAVRLTVSQVTLKDMGTLLHKYISETGSCHVDV